MGRLSRMLQREPTNSSVALGTTVFTTSGIYYPKFGKHLVYVSGRGASGNSPAPGTIAGYNPVVPGNYVSTNPVIPGNYAYTNPTVPGNYAGSNPPSGHTVAGYNPYVPGNVYYNPPQPAQTIYQVINYDNGGHYESTDTYAYFPVAPYSYNNPPGTHGWVTVTYGGYVPGNSVYNPPSGGTAYYNPTIPGNAYYNPPSPGNIVYNPSTPGTQNYNSPTPGTAIYNPYVPGVAAAPITTLNVYFPGGDASSLAPAVPERLVDLTYTNTGIPVTVGQGGVVTVREVLR